MHSSNTQRPRSVGTRHCDLKEARSPPQPLSLASSRLCDYLKIGKVRAATRREESREARLVQGGAAGGLAVQRAASGESDAPSVRGTTRGVAGAGKAQATPASGPEHRERHGSGQAPAVCTGHGHAAPAAWPRRHRDRPGPQGPPTPHTDLRPVRKPARPCPCLARSANPSAEASGRLRHCTHIPQAALSGIKANEINPTARKKALDHESRLLNANGPQTETV